MISGVQLRGGSAALDGALFEARARLRTELGCRATIVRRSELGAEVAIRLEDWSSDRVDLLDFDGSVHAAELRDQPFRLELACASWEGRARVAVEVLTRYQRLLPLEASEPVPWWNDVLQRHRSLHDLGRPLVRADYEHAHDTWRWLLRLSPRAPLPLQIAALFHDIERLESEADARLEQHASDYVRFKARHARRGAELCRQVLSEQGVEAPLAERAAWLVERHEEPGADPELSLLNDADGLSFFSLNSWGYLRYFGAEQTRAKVAYTLRRMSLRAHRLAFSTRQPPEIAPLLREAWSCHAGA